MSTVERHPVQIDTIRRSRRGRISSKVTIAAYEVYSHIHRPQPAMITGGCRGGFSIGELVAFLYARSFPKSEWEMRVQEALSGMDF